MNRGDVEDWLSEKHAADFGERREILFWARIAGVAGVIGVVIALAFGFLK